MKTLWALEPFHHESKQVSGFFKLMAEIAGAKDSVETCFIVTRTENDLSLAFDLPLEKRFTEYPRQQIIKLFKKARVPIPDSKIQVIDYPTLSRTKAVDRLLDVAKEKQSELIALFTHSRQGYKRLLLGSFAETAVLRSPVPLLLASPLTKFPPRLRRIFFASDFSKDSEKHLRTVLNLCQRLSAKLFVFHAAQPIYRRSLDETNPEVINYRKEVDAHCAWIAAETAKAGVEAEIQISADFTRISDSTVKTAAKAKADLVIVAAKSGATTAFFGGSVTRQIVRSSQLPVLVLR